MGVAQSNNYNERDFEEKPLEKEEVEIEKNPEKKTKKRFRLGVFMVS